MKKIVQVCFISSMVLYSESFEEIRNRINNDYKATKTKIEKDFKVIQSRIDRDFGEALKLGCRKTQISAPKNFPTFHKIEI